MDTRHRRLFGNFLFFFSWRIGWNEGRSVFSKKAAELSEIIMEINDLRRVARAPDRPEQDRRRFATAPFTADLIPKISMNKPYNALTHLLYHTYLGLQILSREGEIPSSPNIS